MKNSICKTVVILFSMLFLLISVSECCCCCRWQIECRCLCSALNSSSCYKKLIKWQNRLFFTQLTWSFRMHIFVCVCDWHSQSRLMKKKRCEGAETKFHWLLFVSEWLKCTPLMQCFHRYIPPWCSCHAFYLKLWSLGKRRCHLHYYLRD